MNITLNKTRIDWIDALKGFAIFCVTVGHCSLWNPIEKHIYSFHMFLFFFISGYLFSVKRDVIETIKNKVKRLLIPFLLWNSFSAAVGFALNRDFSNFIEELFVINGNLTWNAALWFLLVLFIVEVICIIFRLYNHTFLSWSVILLSILLWILIGHSWLLWKFNLVPMGLAFFLFGYLFKPLMKYCQRWYFLLLSAIGSIVFSQLNIRIVYTTGNFGNYSYCIIAAVCGVLFYVGVFSRIKSFERLQFLISWGKNSLVIMATQFMIFNCICLVSKYYTDVDLITYPSSIISLLIALFTITIINSGIMLFKKLTYSIRFIRKIGESFGVKY